MIHPFQRLGVAPGRQCEFGMWQPTAIRNRTLAESEPVGSFDRQGKGSDREGPSYYCQSARTICPGGTTPPEGLDPQSSARSGTGLAWRGRAWQSAETLLNSDGVKNGVARLRGEGNLRVKRSDP